MRWPGRFGGDVAEQVRNHALREVVRFDLVGDGEPLQLRHESPVAADDATDQALMAKMIESALFAVALARGIDQREISRLVRSPGMSLLRRIMCASSAIAISSAKPMPTKPPVATVSPSRMRRTASSAVTILPLSGALTVSVDWLAADLHVLDA